MPYIVQAAESNNPDVEDGKYRAIIDDMTSEAGTYGDAIRWKFRLLDEPYIDIVLSAMSSPTLTPNSKIWPWYVALGYQLEVGMEFDLLSPIGMECWVMVERKPSKKDASIIYSNVTKIVPPPKMGPAAHAGHPVQAHVAQPHATQPALPMAARPAQAAQPRATQPMAARPAQPVQPRPGQPQTSRPMAPRPAAPRPAPVQGQATVDEDLPF
jgi:hypothetical protein